MTKSKMILPLCLLALAACGNTLADRHGVITEDFIASCEGEQTYSNTDGTVTYSCR